MSWINGKPVAVIKVGGDILLDAAELQGLCGNIQDLVRAGWHCVLLHGGGAQVSALQAVHGLPVNKVAGRRITSVADLAVVKQALCGEVTLDLVSALSAHGLPAFGCSGASGKLIQAAKRPPVRVSGGGDKLIDFGEVGDVTGINVDLLTGLITLGQIPVIASLGIGHDGRLFNINADNTAAMLATSLRAQALILTTSVGAVYLDLDDPASRIEVLSEADSKRLINDGRIADGMIPKVEQAFNCLHSGVSTVAISGAAKAHSFLNAVSASSDTGTLFSI